LSDLLVGRGSTEVAAVAAAAVAAAASRRRGNDGNAESVHTSNDGTFK